MKHRKKKRDEKEKEKKQDEKISDVSTCSSTMEYALKKAGLVRVQQNEKV